MLHRPRSRARTRLCHPPSGFVDGVGAFLHTPSRGRGIPVLLDALSLHDARIRIRNELEPLVCVGGYATLELVHESGVEVRLSARLAQLREDRIARSLVLHFVGAAGASALLDPRLAHLFDKRGSFRVRPDERDPVKVTVMAASGERYTVESATVFDVSTGGLGLVVSRQFERVAAATTRVRCLLRLPGGEAHDVHAEIRHRSVYGPGSVRYGLCLDLGSTRTEQNLYEELLAYVLDRLARA